MIKYFKTKLLDFIADRFGIPQTAIAYIKPISIAGKQTNIGLPKDLVSLNVLNLTRGIYNRIVFASYSNWIWPYWVVKQYDSKSMSFIPRGFQIPSMNVAHRNWTGIGNLYQERESIIDTHGLVTPRPNSWSFEIWIKCDDKLFTPSKMEQVKQRVIHGIPMIETTFEVNDFVIIITTFTELIYERDTIFHHVNVTNYGDQSNEINIYFAIRPYNPEGISLIHKLNYTHEQFFVNSSFRVALMEKPHAVLCSNLKLGDVSLFLNDPAFPHKNESKCEAGLCTGVASYSYYLNPGEVKDLEFRIPMDKNIVIRKTCYKEGTYDSFKQRMISTWKKKLEEGIKITIPDKKIEKAFRTNISYLLLFHDGKSITPGPFNYHHFWFRDAAYLLPALLKAGYFEEAKEVITTYPSRRTLNGFFYSQQSEWDSNGQAIYTIADFYKVTKDKKFLKKLYPDIQAGANWIIRKLKSTSKKKCPYKGLMPIGLSAEHFGANDVYYWDDYWSLKGLIDAKFLLEEIPEEKINTAQIDDTIVELRKNIHESLEFANKKLDKPHLPIGPNRYMDSAAIGSLAVIYPLHIFSPDDIRVINTMNFLEEQCFTNGAFFHDINHSGHGTYLNMHIAQVFISQRNRKALDLIDWMTNIATNTFTWPESIHPFTGGGVIGDGHHGWAAADYFMAIRNMLFMEENEKLVFTPVIPSDWLSLYDIIQVEDAPSYFGTINFSYEVTSLDVMEIKISNIYTDMPKVIEINLPFQIKSIEIDGATQEIEGNKFLISPVTAHVLVHF